jgi:CubicO group peptidase (beta-lactamase class C family)
MKLISKIIASCVLLIVMSNTNAQNLSARLDSIFQPLSNAGQFSGNVLIAQNGKPIYEKCFGMADIDKHIANNVNMRFQLASVSKQFTAMGIVLLKESGKISYDDTITKFIPELPYHGITIRQLLNHTSGVPDYFPMFLQYWDKTKFADNNDVIKLLVQYHPPVFFPPGQKYLYSNTGYALLATVIEKVSGTSFKEFMADNVFKRFGLKHTLVCSRHANPINAPDFAIGYVYADSLKAFVIPEQHPMWKTGLWEDAIYGEDGVNSTVGDMLKWDQAVYNRAIISNDDWQQILTAGATAEGSCDYGFGWHLKNNAAFHTGGWPGFIIYNEQGLENNYSIIILRNKFTTQTRVAVDPIKSIINADK